MLSHLTLADLGLSFVNDTWGWTDPQTRRDYALLGGSEGTVIIDTPIRCARHRHAADPHDGELVLA